MSVPSTRKVYREEDVAGKWQFTVEWSDFQCGTPFHVSQETSMQVGDSYCVWKLSRTYNHCWYDVSERFSVQVQGCTLYLDEQVVCEMDVLPDATTIDSCIGSVRHRLQAMTRGCRGSVIQSFVRLD